MTTLTDAQGNRMLVQPRGEFRCEVWYLPSREKGVRWASIDEPADVVVEKSVSDGWSLVTQAESEETVRERQRRADAVWRPQSRPASRESGAFTSRSLPEPSCHRRS